MRTVRMARIPNPEASETIPMLIEMGLVDRSAKISRADGFRLVPIVSGREADALSLGFDLEEGPAYTMERRSPQELIAASFSDLPDYLVKCLPMKWEYIGSIAIIRLDSELRPYRERIGRTYAEILGADTICADLCGVSGELRRPSMEVLYGDNTESVRLENGIRYDLDVTKVMFASGNTDERNRMGKLDCTGETVVDMFAGIGYFTLPIAKFTGARKVFACEKNLDSYRFLLRNMHLNDVEDTVIPILADNRSLLGKAFADRILMGYVQRTSDFVPKAVEMIKPNGIIHYHDTFYIGEYLQHIKSIFEDVCGKGGFSIESVHEVKSFAPSVSHYVADIRIF
jgi:tRNA wybutosine-synthesizing protein 2